MFGTTITAIVIAALAGLATFYSWDRNKGLSAVLAIVTAVASAVAILFAFVGALAVIFKILPIVLLVFGLWLIWRVFLKKSDSAETRERGYSTPAQR
ncbi:hypothetical protein [Corynebacterium halotolerans]|uniref:hypothetical protein n=1 Tax=Corynebacterium halotolerans TaxID=225326 RepID=UPI003CE7B294